MRSDNCNNLEIEQLLQYHRDLDSLPTQSEGAAKGLKQYDDTSSKDLLMWALDLRDANHAYACPNGDHTKCLLCVGRGKTKGTIKSRRNFDVGHWNKHCDSQGHQNALSHYEPRRIVNTRKQRRRRGTQICSNTSVSYQRRNLLRMKWKQTIRTVVRLTLPRLLSLMLTMLLKGEFKYQLFIAYEYYYLSISYMCI